MILLIGMHIFPATLKKSPEKQQFVILAAYSYPFVDSDYWKAVIREGGEKIPYVVINPNNGPGNKVDLNYVRQLEENIKAGIKNIAYIRTNYQKRSLKSVLADVDKYYRLYGKNNLSGFFFDEFFALAEQAGLKQSINFSSWECHPFTKGSDFLVAVLAKA